MSDLLAIAGVLAAAAALGAGLLLVPGGAALVAAALNSRIGQGLIALGAAVLAVITIRTKAKREGAAEARAEVQRENARAVERRRKIETEVAQRPDDELTAKLRRYSRD